MPTTTISTLHNHHTAPISSCKAVQLQGGVGGVKMNGETVLCVGCKCKHAVCACVPNHMLSPTAPHSPQMLPLSRQALPSPRCAPAAVASLARWAACLAGRRRGNRRLHSTRTRQGGQTNAQEGGLGWTNLALHERPAAAGRNGRRNRSRLQG